MKRAGAVGAILVARYYMYNLNDRNHYKPLESLSQPVYFKHPFAYPQPKTETEPIYPFPCPRDGNTTQHYDEKEKE